MLTLRKSEDSGFADRGWLQSHHSFSFADYYNPARKACVHVVRGMFMVNGKKLRKVDAVLLANESKRQLSEGVDEEVLVFDLAP